MEFKRILYAFTFLLFLTLLVGCDIRLDNKIEDITEDKKIDDITEDAIKTSNDNMLALAAYKNIKDNTNKSNVAASMETTTNHLLNNQMNSRLSRNNLLSNNDESWQDEKGIWHAIYPFDFIKIEKAMQFTITGDDEKQEFLEDVCGTGDIIVIIAEFSTYRADNLERSLISDQAIIFLGSEGIYSCLLNGGGISNSAWDPSGKYDSYQYFNSHKQITNQAVEKDFTYPLMKFTVYRQKDIYSLEYSYMEEGKDYQILKNYSMVNESLIEVNNKTIYDILELQKIQEYEIECIIKTINIDGSIEIINTITALELVYINDNTKVYDNDQVTNYPLAEGMTIKIFYNKFFDAYNPKKAVVNKIVILNHVK